MEKNELSNLETSLKPKISEFSWRVFAIIKFILGVCLLPFVYSASVSFLKEIALIEKVMQNYFWFGLVGFLIVYLFIWEPTIIYVKGQRIVELIFIFFKPLVKVAPYLLPIHTIVLFIAYQILFLAFGVQWLTNYFILFFGFSIGMHLVFCAKSLRLKQTDFLKANYIFGFSFIYIINTLLISSFLALIYDDFSFINFSNNAFHIGKDIFLAIFRQLFYYQSN